MIIRVLSKYPRFDARSNYTKSNQLRAASVPNVYLGTVSTKTRPNPNRPVPGEPVVARANPQVGRRRPRKAQPKYRPEPLPPEIPPVLATWSQGRGKFGYSAPTNAKGRFRPRNGILGEIPPKHSSPGMI